jgi:Flp pilus assembly protein TadG
MIRRIRSRRGNALVEFSLASAVILPLFAGAFQFGYTFYVYNLLLTQVRGGARYASLRQFKAADATSIGKYKTAVRNMVRYSTPDGVGTLIVPQLTDSSVVVNILDKDGNAADANHAPASVNLSVNNFTMSAVFTTFTFNQKPYLDFPYVGRYAPSETEP